MNTKVFLLHVLIICFSSKAADPVMLVDDLSSYCSAFVVMDTGEVAFVGNEGGIHEVSLLSPMESSAMDIQWGSLLEDWGDLDEVLSLSGNSSGSMICFSQFIFLPENMSVESDFAVPAPLLVGVCGSDGSDARLMGLSMDVGGSPQFHFTSDSRYVYGSRFLECLPAPGAYAEFMTGVGERLEDFLMVNVETGARKGDPAIFSDGFYPNPYSDLAAAGWYPPNTIVDVTSQEVILQDTCIQHPTIVHTWVLPDAGLARTDGGQILRYSSGREVRNTGEELVVYCRLTDERYVFSRDGGSTVFVGSIDWSDFEAPDAVEVPGLAGMLGLYSIMKPVPGTSGAVFRSADALYYIELPEDLTAFEPM